MKVFDYRIPLDYEALSLGGGHRATMTCYLPSNCREISPDRRRPAVLVIPGGSYRYCSRREGEPVALQYVARDFAAFLLEYSTSEDAGYPRCLFEALAAIRAIRKNAAEWTIDPDRVAVLGFSAGGHLAASVGAFWNTDLAKNALGENELLRPNALLLGYALISSDLLLRHQGSIMNLLGEDPDPVLLGINSLEKHVTNDFPPTFLWHTFPDQTVPVQNSIVLAKALADHGILFECHIYPSGCHGLALSDSRTARTDEEGKPLERHLEERPREWMNESILFLERTVFGVK